MGRSVAKGERDAKKSWNGRDCYGAPKTMPATKCKSNPPKSEVMLQIVHEEFAPAPPTTCAHAAQKKRSDRFDMMEVPGSLAHLIAVNSEFAVLLCRRPHCAYAQTPKGIAEHLRKIHYEKPSARRQALEFECNKERYNGDQDNA